MWNKINGFQWWMWESSKTAKLLGEFVCVMKQSKEPLHICYFLGFHFQPNVYISLHFSNSHFSSLPVKADHMGVGWCVLFPSLIYSFGQNLYCTCTSSTHHRMSCHDKRNKCWGDCHIENQIKLFDLFLKVA